MKSTSCCRCPLEATYVAPRNFCDEHWARFWGGYDPEFPYEDGAPPNHEMYESGLRMAKRSSLGQGKVD